MTTLVQKTIRVFFLLALSICAITNALAKEKSVLVQSTTSTANSGLYRYLLPLFEQQSGIKVNVVAVGTGQAIRNARNCDADVLLVHAKQAEEMFVADGYGIERFELMYNDFVIVGPKNNPANIASDAKVSDAMQSIANSRSIFASRGDDSGTHKKELSLWSTASPDTKVDDEPWYRSVGSGMGATLNTAIGLGAYTITDRATWISFNNKQDYSIAFEGDPLLFNQYGVILVNPEKCPTVSVEPAQQFIDWLVSAEAQQKIAEFKIDGQQLFYPNAK